MHNKSKTGYIKTETIRKKPVFLSPVGFIKNSKKNQLANKKNITFEYKNLLFIFKEYIMREKIINIILKYAGENTPKPLIIIPEKKREIK